MSTSSRQGHDVPSGVLRACCVNGITPVACFAHIVSWRGDSRSRWPSWSERRGARSEVKFAVAREVEVLFVLGGLPRLPRWFRPTRFAQVGLWWAFCSETARFVANAFPAPTQNAGSTVRCFRTMDPNLSVPRSAAPRTGPKPSGSPFGAFFTRSEGFCPPFCPSFRPTEVSECANVARKRVSPTIPAHPFVVSAMNATISSAEARKRSEISRLRLALGRLRRLCRTSRPS